MKKFYQPALDVQKELDIYLRRVFPGYFKETNVHSHPVGVIYDDKGGKVTAVVTLRWQRKPEYNEGQHTALFDYQDTQTQDGRKYQWYCRSGLPGD